MTAVGVANATTQAQATSSTAMAARGSRPIAYVNAAAEATIGMYQAVKRSARRCTGALLASASSTRRTMRPSVESAPTRVTRTRSAPPWTIVPAKTSCPGPRSTGMLSPVIGDWSTAA